jgi:hypothetical protein
VVHNPCPSETQKTSEERGNEACFTASKGRFYADVPPSEFMRMQMEALRPVSVIQVYESKLKEGPIGSDGYSLSVYAGESDIWN